MKEFKIKVAKLKIDRSTPMVFNDQSPSLNGIACPVCGEELYDSNPMITLDSFPEQKNVHCSSCEYIGYRTVNNDL